MRLAFCATPSYPAAFAISRRQFSPLQILPREMSRRQAPRRVRCFRWIDSRALPLCKLPFRRQTLRLVHIPLGLFLWKPTSYRLGLPFLLYPPELRLHCCESFLRPAVTGRRASSALNEEVPVTRLIPDCDGIPWAHDLVESCLESVRSNGNSFTSITGICHGKKRRAMKT